VTDKNIIYGIDWQARRNQEAAEMEVASMALIGTERLGPEFERVLYENLPELYLRENSIPEQKDKA
jgi:hypothetical protein